MPSVSELTGYYCTPRTFAPSDELVMPYCNVGIEVEIEQAYDLYPEQFSRTQWEVTHDGSLRDCGYELRFLGPLFGEDVIMALNDLVGTLNDVAPVATERCSVHVHVDVRDMSTKQLFTMIVLYMIFERSLIKYHGSTREDNIFALPYYRAPDKIASLGILGAEVSTSTMLSKLGGLNKYAALNLAALFTHGTVEFRHMPGSWSKARILEWVNLILSLKKHAMESEYNLTDFPATLSLLGPVTFAKSVFGDLFDKLPGNVSQDVMRGVRLAQDAIYAFKMNEVRDQFQSMTANQPSEAFRKFCESRGYKVRTDAKSIERDAMSQIYRDYLLDL